MTKEDGLQIACANYLRLQYPNALWIHVANERQTSRARGSKLKQMGVTPGVPDILVFEPVMDALGVKEIGLAIELKIKPNKSTPAQAAFQKSLDDRAWQVHVIYDFDTFKKVVDNYLH